LFIAGIKEIIIVEIKNRLFTNINELKNKDSLRKDVNIELYNKKIRTNITSAFATPLNREQKGVILLTALLEEAGCNKLEEKVSFSPILYYYESQRVYILSGKL
jgi:DNA-directed RNA polymerase